MREGVGSRLDQKLLLEALIAYQQGNFDVRLPEWRGRAGQIAAVINDLFRHGGAMTEEVRQIGRRAGLDMEALLPGRDIDGWSRIHRAISALLDGLMEPIAEMSQVIGAVTQGDLSRSIGADVRGEMLELKRNINAMIDYLRQADQNAARQTWLNSHLARIARLLHGQRNLEEVTSLVFAELATLLSVQHGVFYIMDDRGPDERLRMVAGYGCRADDTLARSFRPGEGLVGQCALDARPILLDPAPSEYIRVGSALGSAAPAMVAILPVLFDQRVKAVLEIATFESFNETQLGFLDQLLGLIGVTITTIEANGRTESLLEQSQSLAQELQQINQELAQKARLLSNQNRAVEHKNHEVESARHELEEKARQLALSSRYKSEFLANMSHELRTPLNSMLMLAQELGDNPENNLTPQQVEYARIIHRSGSDLLELINEILDFSKIESGTVTVEYRAYEFAQLRNFVERTFRHMAHEKQIDFVIELAEDLPSVLHTDALRLQQILKNLLSNAFKFTPQGQVTLRIAKADSGWTPVHAALAQAGPVLAFEVIDTGIGIPQDKLGRIFEAFQQADGGTARKYGGTGLGLSISRDLAQLLQGEIQVQSTQGQGSRFTLYLPLEQPPQPGGAEAQAPHPDQDPGPAAAATASFEPAAAAAIASPAPQPGQAAVPDRAPPQEPVVLLANHGEQTTQALVQAARDMGTKAIVVDAAAVLLPLARAHQPACILVGNKGDAGETAQCLRRLGLDIATRHIPLHVSRGQAQAGEAPAQLEAALAAMRQALQALEPARRLHARDVLLISDDSGWQEQVRRVLEGMGLRLTLAVPERCLAILASQSFAGMILGGPHAAAHADLLATLCRDLDLRQTALIWYRAQNMPRLESPAIRRLIQQHHIRQAGSEASLLDQVVQALHLAHASLPAAHRETLERLLASAVKLAGVKVLIIDTDLRSIFMQSAALARQQMQVRFAENSRDGLLQCEQEADIKVVLLDITAVQSEGLQALRALRESARDLPIIGMSAGDLACEVEAALAAGASDCIAKSGGGAGDGVVDSAALISTLGVWLQNE